MKSHRGGGNTCFNSAYRCNSDGDAADEGTYRWAEQERENAITDWQGNLFFHLSGVLLRLLFLDLDEPNLVLLFGSKRRVSPGFLFLSVCVVMSFFMAISACILHYKHNCIRCEVWGKQLVLNSS